MSQWDTAALLSSTYLVGNGVPGDSSDNIRLVQATAKEHDAHLRRAREALEDDRKQMAAQRAQLAKRQAVVCPFCVMRQILFLRTRLCCHTAISCASGHP